MLWQTASLWQTAHDQPCQEGLNLYCIPQIMPWYPFYVICWVFSANSSWSSLYFPWNMIL
jgi:hypothetical protein